MMSRTFNIPTANSMAAASDSSATENPSTAAFVRRCYCGGLVLVVPVVVLPFGSGWPGCGVPGVPAGLLPIDPGAGVVVPLVVPGLITLPLVAEFAAGDPVVELVPAVVPVVALLSVLVPVVALLSPGRPVVLEPIVPVPVALVPFWGEPTVPVPVVVEPVVPSVVLPTVPLVPMVPGVLWPAGVPVVP